MLNSRVGFKTLKKIDIYLRNLNGFFTYECSSRAYQSCKSARSNFAKIHGLHPDQVKARFSEK